MARVNKLEFFFENKFQNKILKHEREEGKTFIILVITLNPKEMPLR